MSDFRIDQITNQAGTAGPNIAGITTFNTSSGVLLPSGNTEYRGGRGRGLFGGGYGSPVFTRVNNIDYITISTLSNSFDFGDLSAIKTIPTALASSTRGIFGGGQPTSPGFPTNVIEYVTISSTGNAFDFGDLLTTKGRPAACSNSTRGIFAGGYISNPNYTGLSTIEYITISTLGNSSFFGDLFTGRYALSSCASPTRGIFAGGSISSPAPSITYNIIDFITISTLGNAQDFGDLLISGGGRRVFSGCSNSIRGLFGGGIESPSGSQVNTIEYITIASTGDAVDFGDLTSARRALAATSNNTRGVFAGGYISPNNVNTIDFVTISSTGNATTFGNLSRLNAFNSACSDAHGGLGD